jgi:NAD-dependent dihydropyrimidine dehydrogenase PreA subunit
MIVGANYDYAREALRQAVLRLPGRGQVLGAENLARVIRDEPHLLSCPVDVIRLDPVSNKAVVAYGNDCHVCYLCEDDCPEKSITLSHDISNSRRFSTYDQFGLKI